MAMKKAERIALQADRRAVETIDLLKTISDQLAKLIELERERLDHEKTGIWSMDTRTRQPE
jgi:hypothetical protein